MKTLNQIIDLIIDEIPDEKHIEYWQINFHNSSGPIELSNVRVE